MNLANTTPGATYTAIMTCSDVNPSAGTVYRVEWGNGIGTALFLGNGIVGVGTSTAALTRMQSGATTVRDVTWPDESGVPQLAPSSGVRHQRLATTHTNSTTSVAPTGLSLSLPQGTWMVTVAGIYRSTATGNGVRLTLSGSGASVLAGGNSVPPFNADVANQDIPFSGSYLVTVSSGTGTVELNSANEASSQTLTIPSLNTFMAAVRVF